MQTYRVRQFTRALKPIHISGTDGSLFCLLAITQQAHVTNGIAPQFTRSIRNKQSGRTLGELYREGSSIEGLCLLLALLAYRFLVSLSSYCRLLRLSWTYQIPAFLALGSGFSNSKDGKRSRPGKGDMVVITLVHLPLYRWASISVVLEL